MGVTPPRLLSLIALFFVVASVHGQCNATSIYQTYQELVDCLQSEPLDSGVKNDTLASLNSIVPSYVFVDAVKKSPDETHIPMSIDILAELNEIAAKDYTIDEAFQQDLASLFTQLQDAHTRYTKPLEPYCASAFAVPFHFYSRVTQADDNTLQQNLYISIDADMVAHYNEVYPTETFDPSVDNFMVIQINNEDPLGVIGQFANSSVGYSKDYSARFNLAVDGYGGDFRPMYTYRNQSLQGIPSSPMKLRLRDPETKLNRTIQANWLGIYDPSWINVEAIQEETASSLVGTHQLQHIEKAFHLDFNRDYEEPEGNRDIYYTTINGTLTTGVLRIYTFAPSDRKAWIAMAEEAVCYFNSVKIDRLIIDVSQNGGGSICLGYALEEFLFPGLRETVGAYDLKGSSLFKLFASTADEQMCDKLADQLCAVDPEVAGYFTPCAWYDWYSRDQYYDDTWFIPGKVVKRGGTTGDYSSFVTQNCDVEFTRWFPGEVVSLNLDAENIILVSDGLCGSTCAVFSRHLQLSHRVKTVTTGGVLGGQQPSFTSFPGGEVVHLDYMQELAKRYDLVNNSLVPRPLNTTADYRFAIREIYGWDDIGISSTPQEFVYLPADFQIFYTENYQNHSAIWQQVLPLFDQCIESIGHPCKLELRPQHGSGQAPCIDGILKMDTCVVISCNPGYELSAGNKCVPCGAGTYKSSFGTGTCALCPNSLPSNCNFSSTGNTSPNCEFVCESCPVCSSTSTKTEVNTICLPTWAFCLLLVGISILSMSFAGFLGSWATLRYSPRVWYKVASPDTIN